MTPVSKLVWAGVRKHREWTHLSGGLDRNGFWAMRGKPEHPSYKTNTLRAGGQEYGANMRGGESRSI